MKATNLPIDDTAPRAEYAFDGRPSGLRSAITMSPVDSSLRYTWNATVGGSRAPLESLCRIGQSGGVA